MTDNELSALFAARERLTHRGLMVDDWPDDAVAEVLRLEDLAHALIGNRVPVQWHSIVGDHRVGDTYGDRMRFVIISVDDSHESATVRDEASGAIETVYDAIGSFLNLPNVTLVGVRGAAVSTVTSPTRWEIVQLDMRTVCPRCGETPIFVPAELTSEVGQ